ncbi:Asp-tRNA(Asn)/Glu-tRNA(Gln) amidotransferase subunit GatA [Dehalococcoidia bacterium]|nr:Asp-tRNA(Asn)/Glu-tRNA(Gln) amidotransferase subunit GatA [Dehalococcoidia bacterium]
MAEYHELTIQEAHALLLKREISSVELTQGILGRIDAVETRVKAYTSVTSETALRQAATADERIASGDCGPLTGIPMQIKDNITTEGIATTCASRMLEGFVPPYSATVTEKLYSSGAVLLGKGNMDEFAMGSSTENSAFFPTRNPWDLERVPGGSSGGPAAAVAAGECLFSLGSDTGGSIRQPASFCNVVGLKPTYGRVSRYGLVAFASSLDQIGPMTKNVLDAAAVLGVIAGHDHRDSTCVDYPVPKYEEALGEGIKGLKLGVPKEYLEGIDPDVSIVFRRCVDQLAKLGAEVDWDVSLPSTRYSLAVYYILAPSEASANLARYDGVKYGYSANDGESMWDTMEKTRQNGFGPEVKRRIMLGTYALSTGYYDAYYLKAQKVRTIIRREFDNAFEKYDALVTPTSPTVPFRIGEKLADPVQMYLSDIGTIPANIAGIPGISVPGGFLEGLPVGLQIIGPVFGEETLLKIAFAYEQSTGWHNLRANLG